MPRRKDEPGFTRRRFLKTVGPCGVTAGVLTQASAVEREPGVGAVGPGQVGLTMNINGQTG